MVGHNLGLRLSDVLSVGLALPDGTRLPCSSLLHFNSSALRCVFSQPAVLGLYRQSGDSLPAELVEVRTASGVVRGLSLNAAVIVAEKSFRPAITGLTVTAYPFAPTQLAALDGALYWLNAAASARSLQRSRPDGSGVETVLAGLGKGSALAALSASLNGQLDVLSLGRPSGNPSANPNPSCVAAYAPRAAADCVLAGHVLFAADFDAGRLLRLNLLPTEPAAAVFLLNPFRPQDGPAAGSLLVAQESSAELRDVVRPTVLLEDLGRPSALALDLTLK